MNGTLNDMIRARIEMSGSRYIAVKAQMKNGEVRTFVYNPKETRPLIKDGPVSISHAKGAATRAERYPNLINIWDRGPAKIAKYGAPGASCFDLDRVLAVHSCGFKFKFREPRST